VDADSNYNRTPVGWQEAKNTKCFWDLIPAVPPNFADEAEEYAYSMLLWVPVTTPVSYISVIPKRVFRKTTSKGSKHFNLMQPLELNSYYTHVGMKANDENAIARGYTWSQHCNGPHPDIGGGIAGAIGRKLDGSQEDKKVKQIYDPTNGTVSEGYIAMTNKGFYKGTDD